MSRMKFLSVCGADDSTDLDDLKAVCDGSPINTMIGVLVGKSEIGSSRYPSNEGLVKLRDKVKSSASMLLSFHLCGSAWVKEVLFGKQLDPKVRKICSAFAGSIGAIQLNIAGFESEYESKYTPAEFTLCVMKFLNLLRQHVYLGPNFMLILQCRSINQHISTCMEHCNSVYPLIDRSGGRGILVDTGIAIGATLSHQLVGIAGGINITNVHRMVDTLSQCDSESNNYWLCVETGCMGAGDEFSTEKVKDLVRNINLFEGGSCNISPKPMLCFEPGVSFKQSLADHLRALVAARYENRDEKFSDFWVRNGWLITQRFKLSKDAVDYDFAEPKFLCQYARRHYMEIVNSK